MTLETCRTNGRGRRGRAGASRRFRTDGREIASSGPGQKAETVELRSEVRRRDHRARGATVARIQLRHGHCGGGRINKRLERGFERISRTLGRSGWRLLRSARPEGRRWQTESIASLLRQHGRRCRRCRCRVHFRSFREQSERVRSHVLLVVLRHDALHRVATGIEKKR